MMPHDGTSCGSGRARERGGRCRVLDIAEPPGNPWFLAAPDGLADLPPLPHGWTLVDEGNLGGVTPGGGWERTYADREAAGGHVGGPGSLEIIQAFGGGPTVTGGPDTSAVEVGGVRATLYREPRSGELVLTWHPRTDGLGLVANEADFSVAELIAFAAGIEAP